MKREKSRRRTILGTALLAATIFTGNAAAGTVGTPPLPMQLPLLAMADNAMAQTHRLLNESSAAKSIIASGNTEAKSLRNEAMALYEQAAKADAGGDVEIRDQALKAAKMKLFEAARLVKQAPGLNDRSHALYERRAQSAAALLDAHKRIREELKPGAEVEALESKVITDIAAASATYEKDDVATATRLIDQALSALKSSLISMRNGTTLVRTLHFDSPKEEYEYELDRNQSHALLTTVLLRNKPLPENARQHFDKDMAEAKALRKQAEAQAASGAYDLAIETLEKSTRHIVRAIRAAGVYIPG
ncbi:MAG TPA: hypothetical protein ENK51_03945 [Gammaproteobacteria bacterium]|nr:hypothetical protein [Gammaproteobacteria bacterium]